MLDAVKRVHVEDANCCTANRGDAFNKGASGTEVRHPYLTTRVEKLCHLARDRINAGQVGALVQIAIDAGESQILSLVTAAVLPWNHVLDLQSGERRMLLLKEAVLTSVASSLSNE